MMTSCARREVTSYYKITSYITRSKRLMYLPTYLYTHSDCTSVPNDLATILYTHQTVTSYNPIELTARRCIHARNYVIIHCYHCYYERHRRRTHRGLAFTTCVNSCCSRGILYRSTHVAPLLQEHAIIIYDITSNRDN